MILVLCGVNKPTIVGEGETGGRGDWAKETIGLFIGNAGKPRRFSAGM